MQRSKISLNIIDVKRSNISLKFFSVQEQYFQKIIRIQSSKIFLEVISVQISKILLKLIALKRQYFPKNYQFTEKQNFATNYFSTQITFSYKLAILVGKSSPFELAPYIPTSYCYKHFGSSAFWELILFSVLITCPIFFVISLNPSKEIRGRYF